MKVAILTFHRAYNYGALLQGYALQKTISDDLDIPCEILDYRNKYIEWTYKLLRFDDFIHPKTLLRRMFFLKRNIVAKHTFQNFRQRYLSISKEVYNSTNIEAAEPAYDFFITGSDQVWNGKLTANDTVYYLDFIQRKLKKGSYAASFGTIDLTESRADKIQKSLQNYKSISVREEAGLDILRKIDLSGEVVLDPTFLLNKSEWEKIVVCPHMRKKYVFIFAMTLSKTLLETAKEFATQHNMMPVYVNLYDVTVPRGIKVKTGVTVNEWLGYIKDAEYIFTNSFHGMAFSIIFEKQFFYEKNQSKGAPNSRFDSLIEITGIKDREIEHKNLQLQGNTINYQQVGRKLDNAKLNSMKYLEKMLINK